MLVRAARFALLSAGFFSLIPNLAAQTYVPRKILFSGYTAATQAELLTASGLTAGKPVGQPDIQAAAQRLSDTGLFADISFTFDGQELHYVLKPAGGAQPVLYENFPWWDTKTLNERLAATVPLFHGSVIPESGLQQKVVAALTAMVAEKGVHAEITAVPFRDEQGNQSGVRLQIASPAVQVGSVTITGANAEWSAPVSAIQKSAVGQEYNGALEATLLNALRAIYHRQGYLDVAITDFSHGEPQQENGKIRVPISASINEGAQYRLASLNLSGDVLMSGDEFAKKVRLHPGDIADEDLLRDALYQVSLPYRQKGYLREKIDAVPTEDSATHTVSYTIRVQPGPVYRMGTLTLLNLDEEKKQLVLKFWTLREGDAYDASYAPTFLNRNKRTLHALDSWSATYKQYEHEDTHIVDLVVAFRPDGPVS